MAVSSTSSHSSTISTSQSTSSSTSFFTYSSPWKKMTIKCCHKGFRVWDDFMSIFFCLPPWFVLGQNLSPAGSYEKRNCVFSFSSFFILCMMCFPFQERATSHHRLASMPPSVCRVWTEFLSDSETWIEFPRNYSLCLKSASTHVQLPQQVQISGETIPRYWQ